MRKLYVATTLLCAVLLASLTVFAQTPSRADQKKAAEARRAEFKKKARTLVASKQDRARYADFLKSPNTGLIRLLPREKYIFESYEEATGRSAQPVGPTLFERKINQEGPGRTLPGTVGPRGGSTSNPSPNEGVLTNLRDVPSINSGTGQNRRHARDGGAYYSFDRLTHAYGYGSDLSLEQGLFNVGHAGADYGFLANLGDVPLESITLDTAQTKLFATYIPVRKESDAREEYRRFQQGVSIDGMLVKSRLPMRLHSTYLLRSINYGDSDLLVAFRVVELDAEGTPLILWKRLKRYLTPLLAR